MDNQTHSSIWNRSTTVRCFRSLFSWRGVRRVLIVFAWTATVIALLYAEENWRGHHAWSKYRKQLESRGEQLDWKAFIPKPVPDEQNFAATPFFEFLFANKTNRLENDDAGALEAHAGQPRYHWRDNYERANALVPGSGGRKDRSRRRFIDLVAWQMALEALQAGTVQREERFVSHKFDAESRSNAARTVVEELKLEDALLKELRNASQRPYSRYPVFYDLENPWGILLPHLANTKVLVQRLQIKACAELAAGQSQTALEDVQLMLRLADSIKDEPFLISYLVRVACLQIAVQPIWEGLAEHRWSEAQLEELQSILQQENFLADVRLPLNGERAAGVLTADLLYRKKYMLGNLIDGSDSIAVNWAGRIAPRGWYYQEQLNYARMYDQQLRGVLDFDQKRVHPSRAESNARELEREVAGGRLGRTLSGILRHRLLASLLLPAMSKVSLKAAIAQTVVDEAAIACILERFRLAHGRFPDSLAELTPRFTPELSHDVIAGLPYKYRRTDDGQFILYSVGWNEQDDGGEPGSTLFDDKEGDWVWEYPQP